MVRPETYFSTADDELSDAESNDGRADLYRDVGNSSDNDDRWLDEDDGLAEGLLDAEVEVDEQDDEDEVDAWENEKSHWAITETLASSDSDESSDEGAYEDSADDGGESWCDSELGNEFDEVAPWVLRLTDGYDEYGNPLTVSEVLDGVHPIHTEIHFSFPLYILGRVEVARLFFGLTDLVRKGAATDEYRFEAFTFTFFSDFGDEDVTQEESAWLRPLIVACLFDDPSAFPHLSRFSIGAVWEDIHLPQLWQIMRDPRLTEISFQSSIFYPSAFLAHLELLLDRIELFPKTMHTFYVGELARELPHDDEDCPIARAEELLLVVLGGTGRDGPLCLCVDEDALFADPAQFASVMAVLRERNSIIQDLHFGCIIPEGEWWVSDERGEDLDSWLHTNRIRHHRMPKAALSLLAPARTILFARPPSRRRSRGELWYEDHPSFINTPRRYRDPSMSRISDAPTTSPSRSIISNPHSSASPSARRPLPNFKRRPAGVLSPLTTSPPSASRLLPASQLADLPPRPRQECTLLSLPREILDLIIHELADGALSRAQTRRIVAWASDLRTVGYMGGTERYLKEVDCERWEDDGPVS